MTLRARRSAVSDSKFALSIATMTLIVAGMGVAFSGELANNSSGSSGQTGAGSNGEATYTLTLLITTNNLYDPIMGEQPAYYVVGASGLQSSADISVPANQIVRLVIVDYDNGAPGVNDSTVGQVTGTTNNQMQIINNTLVNSTIGSSGIEIKGVQTVSSMPASEVAHTFTVSTLGINIPVPPLSTVVTYVTLKPGTYTWQCRIPCGGGPYGTLGAMDTAGWMYGNLTVK
jgi:hypothetical protein